MLKIKYLESCNDIIVKEKYQPGCWNCEDKIDIFKRNGSALKKIN